MPKVTIIIPTIEKTLPYLIECVKSLRKTVDWDIVVVSNGTPNPYPIPNDIGITRRLHTRDQGQCIAVNTGIAMSPDADYYMVSNDDMYYAPGWNKNLRFDYLCFSPNLIEPLNNLGSAPPFLKLGAGFTLDEFKRETVDNFVQEFVNGEDMPIGGRETTGFNLPFFIKREVWQTIGGYDTKYDPWGSGSDTDLQMKIELAGIKPMRLRDVLIYHFSNKSGTFDGSHQEFWWRNWHYLEAKWGFNRDELKSDTWMCERMLDYDRLKYKPNWMNKYAA